MKKLVGILSLVFLMAGVAVAQDFPRVEVFGGYQFLRASQGAAGDDEGFSQMFHGWSASGVVNINKYFGVEGVLTGVYGDFYDIDGEPDNPDIDVNARIHNYSYMFGPRLAVRSNRVTGFAHFLLGGSRMSISAAASDPNAGMSSNDFAWAIGGGVDINVIKNFAVRPAQFDFGQIRSDMDNVNLVGYSAGVVVKF